MRIAELRDDLARRVGAPLAGDGGAAVEALRVDEVRRQAAALQPEQPEPEVVRLDAELPPQRAVLRQIESPRHAGDARRDLKDVAAPADDVGAGLAVEVLDDGLLGFGVERPRRRVMSCAACGMT